MGIAFLGLILSCGGEQQPQETIDFNDLAGETGAEIDTVSQIHLVVDESKKINQLAKMLAESFDSASTKASHPIDRFGFNRRERKQFKAKEKVPYGSSMVTPIADFFYYTFSDTNKTINAFYNYLDMMADEGEGGPVRLNEDVDAIKLPPLFMAVYDTVIITAKYQCEHTEQNWNAFQDSVFKLYGTNYKHRIDVKCGGPLKWAKIP